MIKEIYDRRSIRKYKDLPVPKELTEKIIRAGMLAPSSKNRQPWSFIAVSGKARNDMVSALRIGLEREKNDPFLPESSFYIDGAEHTFKIMEQAPVTIFIINRMGADLNKPLTAEERIYEICNAQSIGAAIENMTLEATSLGLGSLWICDIFFAYSELKEWLGCDGEPFAALTLGYADEKPPQRPRLNINEILRWVE